MCTVRWVESLASRSHEFHILFPACADEYGVMEAKMLEAKANLRLRDGATFKDRISQIMLGARREYRNHWRCSSLHL